MSRPPDLRVAADDAELAQRLDDGSGRPTAVESGDMFTTLGARPVGDRTEVLELPIDLIRVALDGSSSRPAVAHVIVRSPWWRGGWWRGDVVGVMNAQFHGRYDVAPRGHPNDGRVETLRVDPSMTLRQRLAVRRRLRTGSHLPHPLIETRSVRSAEFVFRRPMSVRIDGRTEGTARSVTIDVVADHSVLYA